MTDELASPYVLDGVSTNVPEPAITADEAVKGLERPRHRAKVRFAVAFLVSLLVGLVLGAGALYAYDSEYTGRVLPGVSVGGVDLSGLTPEEAAARLESAFAHFGQGQAIVAGGGFEMPIDYADIDRRPDVERMVAEAMAHGRSGNAVERVILDARTAVRGVDLAPLLLFDEVRLARFVQTYAGRLRVEPKDASAAVTEEGFVVTEGEDGQVADRLAPTDYLDAGPRRCRRAVRGHGRPRGLPVEPAVTTDEAIAAKDAAEKIAQDISFVSGKENWTIEAKWVRAWMSFGTGDDDVYQPLIDQARMSTALASFGKNMEKKGSNATFKLSGSKVTGVIPGKDGRGARCRDHRVTRHGPARGASGRGCQRPGRTGPGRHRAESHDRGGPGGRLEDEEGLDVDDLLLRSPSGTTTARTSGSRRWTSTATSSARARCSTSGTRSVR